MSELLKSLGSINSVEEEIVVNNMYSSPFETKDWWENGLSKDELEQDERYCEYWKIVVYRGNYSIPAIGNL